MDQITNKKIGSLFGLAVGDALGAPYEFMYPPYEVSPNYISGVAHDVSPGEWTNDTAMALCLAQSLIDNDGFDELDQLSKYVAWMRCGYMSTRDYCFDIGHITQAALREHESSLITTARNSEIIYSGNGSLMRLAPIPIFYSKNIGAVKYFAALSSSTTHSSKVAIDSCIFYAQLIAAAINGATKDEILNANFVDKTGMSEEVISVINGSYKESKTFIPTGYVVKTMEAALMAFYTHYNFEDGMLAVIALGEDTDTVAAVYGQLAGAYYGFDGIPERWVDGLMKKDLIMDIAIGLANEENK